MKPRDRKWLAAGLAAAVLVAIVWDRVPLADAQGRVARLPAEGFGFASRNVELTAAEQEIFGAAQVAKRVYALGPHRFALVVIDGSHNRHAIHDPTYCFRGGGWSVAATRPVGLRGGEAAEVELTKASERREILFWFSDGRTRHASPARCWRQTAMRRLTLGQSGAEPVLVLIEPLAGGLPPLELLEERLPELFDL